MPKPFPSRRAPSRRALVKALALGAAAAAVLTHRRSLAADAKLDVNDRAAREVGYVEDASRVDTKKYPAYVRGSTCDNCLQLQGKPCESYRPCTLFPGKLVAVTGWCSRWAAEI